MWVRKTEWQNVTKHLETLNNEMGELLTCHKTLLVDVDWTKKLLWAVLSVVLANAIVATVSIVFRIIGIL